MRPAGAYSCEFEVAAATRWNRVALASSVSLVKLVSVRPSGGVDILDKAVCGKIEKKDSVEDGTCVLQLLDYNPMSGEAHYAVHFTILDQDAVEDDVHDVHNNIKDHIKETSAANPKLDAILATVVKGPISKCIY